MNNRWNNRWLFAWFIVFLGLDVLWIGWGNAFQLLSIGHACAVGPPQGLHFDGFGRLVYANPQCPMVKYEHANSVFLLVSAVGLSILGGGVYLLRGESPIDDS